jgi:outer membrane murein-binding lipoprotein Lpp
VASLKYFLLRAVLFVVPFAVFMVLRIGVVLSAIYAVLIAFAINFLFLTRQRNAAASEVRDVFGGRKQVRSKGELADAEVEDALDEAQRADEEAEYEAAAGADGGEYEGAEGGKDVGTPRAAGDADLRGRKAEDRIAGDPKAQDSGE